MALTTTPDSPSTGPTPVAYVAPPQPLPSVAERLVEALRPDQAIFRLPHVAVIVSSVAVMGAAGVLGVFHR